MNTIKYLRNGYLKNTFNLIHQRTPIVSLISNRHPKFIFDNLNNSSNVVQVIPQSVVKHYSTSKAIESESNAGILKKMLRKVGFGISSKSQIKMISFVLYESVADKINYIEFFKEFDLPNTFNSWFIVTELHVWILLVRAMAEGSETGEEGRQLRNSIVEAMWADVNTRAKKLGAINPSATRAQISILSEQFQASLIAYDEGIMSDDKILAGYLWRRFFNEDCNSFTLVERLVKYVRIQVNMLDSLSRQDFVVQPKINWIPLKTIEM